LSHSAHDAYLYRGTHLLPGYPLSLIRQYNLGSDMAFPNLKEFRPMFDNHYSVTENELVSVIMRAPKLECLGPGHIKLQRGTWSNLLSRLPPCNLKRFWLLKPVEIVRLPDVHRGRGHVHSPRPADWKWWKEPGGIDFMINYEEDANLYGAAEEARLIDTQTDWDPREEPKRSRKFEYTGFAIFEQTES
jgi:hypothetical protein